MNITLIFHLAVTVCEVNDGCHENATCIASNGSYNCVCGAGFTGNGFTCAGKHDCIFNQKS